MEGKIRQEERFGFFNSGGLTDTLSVTYCFIGEELHDAPEGTTLTLVASRSVLKRGRDLEKTNYVYKLIAGVLSSGYGTREQQFIVSAIRIAGWRNSSRVAGELGQCDRRRSDPSLTASPDRSTGRIY